MKRHIYWSITLIQPNRMANKLTEKAGLTFNVNTVKNSLKSYYENQDQSVPMFSGGHTAITATLEKLWELLLQECLKKVGKDKSGVRQVNRELLQYSVLLHSGFRRYFLSQLENFDSELQYREQVPIVTKELDQVMERVDKDLSLTQKARNLACFMLLKVFSQIASTSHELLTFAKKKSLDGRCVISAVTIMFHESVASELRKEITRAMKEFGEELDDVPAEEDSGSTKEVKAAAEIDDGDEEEETTPSKSKKGGKETTSKPASSGKSTKKAQVIEEEEDADENEEEEEEEEEAADPAPTKSKGGKKAAASAPAPKKGEKGGSSKPVKPKK